MLDVLLHLHFIVPPTILFLVWLWDRARYYRFAITILVLSYLGALGFALWPAAPPWMASQHHVIPHVAQIASRISSVQVGGAKVTSIGSWIVEHLTRNPSAAVPSLHAAYSFTVVLMAFSISKKLGPHRDRVRGRDVVHDRLLRRALRLGRADRDRARGASSGSSSRRVLPRTWFAGPFPAPLASARGAPNASSSARDRRDRARAADVREHARCFNGRMRDARLVRRVDAQRRAPSRDDTSPSGS